jgi:hypothetical protein
MGTKLTREDVERLLEQRKDGSQYAISEGKEIKFPVVESIQYVANFYEFLAAAIKQGDLDDNLLHSTIGNIVLANYDKIQALHNYYQEPDNRGVPTTDVFNESYWLYHEWKKRDQIAAQRAQSRLAKFWAWWG